tara:strand:- start:480 stop:632 length:153 start_codon:yes stop_codon:yes gene_type:complete
MNTTQDTLALILCLFVGFNLGVPQGVFGVFVIAFVLWWQTKQKKTIATLY